MGSEGATAVAIAFWVFVAVSAVAGIVGDYKKRQATLEPLRMAIERGQQLDPALVEKLLARDSQDKRLQPEYLQVGGIITIGSGVGVTLLAVFLNKVLPGALFPVMGAGLLTVCVGVGLLLAARAIAGNIERERAAARSSGSGA